MSKNRDFTEEEIRANEALCNQHYSIPFCKSFSKNVIRLLNETHFRPLFIGFKEDIPRNNPEHPVILVSNHSGMSFPWDAVIFISTLFQIHDFDYRKTVRSLVAPILSRIRLMNPYQIEYCWKMAGGVDATFLNFETLMRNKDSNVLVYPEGIAGIGKGFNKKYQIQKIASSIVRMSLKYKTDILPFATVNAEYINPYHYSNAWLDKMVRKIGFPFMPIGWLSLVLLLQPWIFYFAFPARLTYVKGKRIRPYDWVNKPYKEVTEQEIQEIKERVHAIMQSQLDLAVEEYGKKPYDWSGLLKGIWKNKAYFPYFLSVGWPFLFEEYKRQRRTRPDEEINLKLGWGSFIRILIQNPITIAYFIPIIGWIPFLIKGYKRQV